MTTRDLDLPLLALAVAYGFALGILFATIALGLRA